MNVNRKRKVELEEAGTWSGRHKQTNKQTNNGPSQLCLWILELKPFLVICMYLLAGRPVDRVGLGSYMRSGIPDWPGSMGGCRLDDGYPGCGLDGRPLQISNVKLRFGRK